MSIRRILFGDPLKTSSLEDFHLSKFKALAIFSSDVLSSVAYATEEILIVLSAGCAFSYALSISFAIGILMAIVCASYWQTIREFPDGGGAFSVAQKNLGENMGLLVAASLLIDYTLTVSVSLSAGARAVISAFPSLNGYSIHMCLAVLLLIVITNLRGASESAGLLAIPTYGFIVCMIAMIIVGVFFSDEVKEFPDVRADGIINSVSCLILLRGFASGCSALTGVEAIAGGVPVFEKPRVKNARITLVIMACILAFLFLGITYLAYKFKIIPSASESVVSQIAKAVYGHGVLYYFVQIMTAFILLLAANTSFSGFPRLASVLAKEKYIPTSFANLGDRLAFSNGIVFLAIVSSILLIMFNADTHALIPLYSIGVFVSFTLSQVGMVIHRLKERSESSYLKAIVSFFGGCATFITLLIIIEGKFFHGAWFLFIFIPLMMYVFKKINRQYRQNYIALDLKSGGLGRWLKQSVAQVDDVVVVPISRMHEGTMAALKFAEKLSNNVTAVVVNVNKKETDKLRLAWRAFKLDIPLVILESPYRSVVTPFLEFLSEFDRMNRKQAIVVMPSFVPGKFWQNILHNQTATIMKAALLYKKESIDKTRIIVDVPFQI